MSSDLLYWVWLSQRLGPGSRKLPGLMSRFGTVYDIYRAPDEELTGFDSDGNENMHPLTDKDLDEACRTVEFCSSRKIGILTYSDPKYPSRLRSLQDPPAVLYYRGQLPDFENRLCVAIVGTRKMTEYGRDAAYKIAYELSESGAVTVSGMALGVDAMAACGALSAGGSTVAVLGCGVDRVYPAKHRELMDAIIAKGCVISEFVPGTEPRGYHFPMRNRIISGLCQGTLVVEADESSGALITARDAIMQGRQIFALPGNITAPGSRGTNALIAEGAYPVTGADSIINCYRELYGTELAELRYRRSKSDFSPKNAKKFKLYYALDEVEKTPAAEAVSAPPTEDKKPKETKMHVAEPEKTVAVPDTAAEPTSDPRLDSLDDNGKRIYAALKPDADTRLEALMSLGIPVPQVMATLTVLEIMGLTEQRPGGAYRKK